MIKKHLWLIINLVCLAIFLYNFVGIYACESLPFYNSQGIPDFIFWGVYGDYMFGCSVGYALATGFFDLVWASVTLLGLLFSWYKKWLKRNLITSLTFIIIWGILSSFSYFHEQERTNIIAREQTTKIEQEKRLEDVERHKEANTPGNYNVSNCRDTLDRQFSKNPVIRIDCFVSVKMTGTYVLRGTLQPVDSPTDGFDPVILESDSPAWGLQDETAVMVHFNYRHLAKNKVMPDGRYVYKIYFYPDGDLGDKLFPHTYTGTTENSYLGSMFSDFPFKPVN
ncbi:hypothetical protein COT50_00265 [candidate division WWE3 bacterium CG08_land_8_20_14_0_20_41_10]|uniref:Uncharacterized protein n=1 Tax=candidate division WWE3 bacterium CG08_land_8_20_14_0_20_41_10 TaxID=1975085 RepID=A0A2H0XCT3_UNCKA|nr:MAG: hypothetical protein COT50_00265 [candidate division WWE3 bacterium CG08_land_8_20_14_0_20_41_10]